MLIALSARHAVPTMFDNRESPDAGGLMGTDNNTENQLGEGPAPMSARILKGRQAGRICR